VLFPRPRPKLLPPPPVVHPKLNRAPSRPTFRLTIGLTPAATGTAAAWAQAFENSEVAKRIKHIGVPANEQNLDRLTAEVLRPPGGG
jgi:hypothetical protein